MQQTKLSDEHESASPEWEHKLPEDTRVLGTLDVGASALQPTVEHLTYRLVVKRDRNRRAIVTALLPIVPFAILGVIEQSLPQDAWIHLCTRPWFVSTAVAACIAFPIWALRPSRKARNATGELAKVEDLSAIGSMVDTLYFGDETGPGEQVRDALIRLLPQVRATDANLLTNRQLGILQTFLTNSAYIRGDLLENPIKKRGKQARLQLAILKAFEQIGDARVLSGVLHAKAHGASREVKKAAADCLPFVKQRVELAKANKTLLRASNQNTSNAACLVRAVDGSASDVMPSEMLRPSANPTSEVLDIVKTT